MPILQPTQLVSSSMCSVRCMYFVHFCNVMQGLLFFFFHVGQRFHNNMSFSLEFFMESDFKEDDARQSTRLFCMHEKCFKSKGQTLPNLFVQNFYSSLFYGIKDCLLKPFGQPDNLKTLISIF